MEARIKNPMTLLPDALPALLALNKSAEDGGSSGESVGKTGGLRDDHEENGEEPCRWHSRSVAEYRRRCGHVALQTHGQPGEVTIRRIASSQTGPNGDRE